MPHPKRKLGLKPRDFSNPAAWRIPHLSALHDRRHRVAAMVPPPMCDNTVGMPVDATMLANDTVGDCFPAGCLRAMEVWSFQAAGAELTPTDAEALQLYSGMTGYNSADPTSDQGTDPISGFEYLLTNGLLLPDGSSSRWLAVFEVDPHNVADQQLSIAQAGVVFFGIDCYSSFMDAQQGGTWQVPGTNDENEGGHFIASAHYPDTTSGFWVKSWGMDIFMPAETAKVCVQSAYVAVSPLWLRATGTTPFGMTVDQLQVAAAAFTQRSLVA